MSIAALVTTSIEKLKWVLGRNNVQEWIKDKVKDTAMNAVMDDFTGTESILQDCCPCFEGVPLEEIEQIANATQLATDSAKELSSWADSANVPSKQSQGGNRV